MDPIAIAGLGVKALGSFLGFGSSSKTNETNLQIARETNQANAELAKYNWEQQKDMWNAQNQYNTPSAQMSRYRDAGLNPNLIYGQGSNGNSTSIPTPATPTMQAAHVDRIPYETLVGGLGDDLLKAYNFKLQREKLENDSDLSASQAAAQRAEANKKTAEIAEIGMRTSKGWQDYEQSRELFGYSRKAADLNVKQMEVNIANANERLKNWPLERQRLNMEIDLMSSNVAKNYSQAKLFSQQILESAQRIVNLAAEKGRTDELTRSLGLDNDFKERSMDDRVSTVAAKLTQLYIDNRWNTDFGKSTGNFSDEVKTLGFAIQKLLGRNFVP